MGKFYVRFVAPPFDAHESRGYQFFGLFVCYVLNLLFVSLFGAVPVCGLSVDEQVQTFYSSAHQTLTSPRDGLAMSANVTGLMNGAHGL
jgi:hypothetical protein